FSVGFWDGVQWRAVGSRFLAGANDLAFDAVGNLYASGHSGISQGDPFAGVAIWDGEQWHDLAEGLLDSSGLSSGGPMLLDEDGNLYLGGSFSEAGGFPANNIAMWSGMPVRSE